MIKRTVIYLNIHLLSRLLLTRTITLLGFNAIHAQTSNDLVIKNVRVVSPEKENIYGLINVIVQQGRITAISNEDDHHDFPADQILDRQGSYLTPRLIDSHANQAFLPGFNEGLLIPRE